MDRRTFLASAAAAAIMPPVCPPSSLIARTLTPEEIGTAVVALDFVTGRCLINSKLVALEDVIGTDRASGCSDRGFLVADRINRIA